LAQEVESLPSKVKALSSDPSTETGVLDVRPIVLGFHMPGLAIHPYMPNKEAW
jgi:hypothetical protein